MTWIVPSGARTVAHWTIAHQTFAHWTIAHRKIAHHLMQKMDNCSPDSCSPANCPPDICSLEICPPNICLQDICSPKLFWEGIAQLVKNTLLLSNAWLWLLSARTIHNMDIIPHLYSHRAISYKYSFEPIQGRNHITGTQCLAIFYAIFDLLALSVT